MVAALLEKLTVFVNNKKIVDDPVPDESLIAFLRRHGFTGTKTGCSEGGCGSCTVAVSDGKNLITLNSCLTNSCAVHMKHVITIEGLGSQKNMNIIQSELLKSNSSQCGYCTPGIAMSLWAELQKEKPNIEECFDGNLCRCTGYRPIWDGARTILKLKESHCGSDCKSCEKKDCKLVDLEDLGGRKGLTYPTELKEFYARNPKGINYMFKGNGITWAHPISMAELLAIAKENPGAKLINGNTEVGIEVRFKNQHYPVLINPSSVPEMTEFKIADTFVSFGGAMTISNFKKNLEKLISSYPEEKTRAFAALLANCKYFAGNQVRNVASIAGNICTASPISDLNPVFLCADAQLHFASLNSKRSLPIREFFLGYRKTAIQAGEILTNITVPFTHSNLFISSFKQAKRKDDDIAIVNAGLAVELAKKGDTHVVKSSCFSYGGMAAISAIAKNTQRFIEGKEWNLETVEQCYEHLLSDFPLSASAPGGQIEFRKTLAQSFLYKFYLQTNSLLSRTESSYSVDIRELSAINEIEREPSRSHQVFQESEGKEVVGKAIPHASGDKQLTGEAIYVDDLPKFHNETYGVVIASNIPHGYIKNDLPPAHGKHDPNMIGPVFEDEELFATKEVLFVGQMIGLLVAEDEATARAAAKLVKVEYVKLDAILTTEEAIEKNSFFPEIRSINSGIFAGSYNPSSVLADSNIKAPEAEHYVSGVARMSAQEHFYLETQASIAVPGKEDDEMEIYSSSQNPKETQSLVADVLGIDFNRVVVRVKRLGGGFGGKETRSAFLSCALAVAARKLGRPVRCMLTREEDMVMTGMRHPFLGNYKVGFTGEGQLVSLELDIYCNGGYSHDLSLAVLERSMTHCDNSYRIPNVRLYGRVCKTNTVTNTAFRGFGGPQGMMVAEQYISHVAEYLKVPIEDIRYLNLYRNGEKTHFDMPLENVFLSRAWDELKISSNFEYRRNQVNEFNKQHKYRKRGISMVPTKFGLAFTARFLNQAGALVHVYTDGSVKVTHGGTEMGQGLHTKMLQIAADAFGIPLERVYISETRTDTVPNTSATAASVSSDINGMAVQNACDIIMARLQPLRESNPNFTWEELVKAAYFDRINLSANGFYKTPDLTYDWATNQGRMFSYFTYGVSCSEVEIDTLTGDHVILASDLIMDIGRPINPAIDIGQIEGAFIQGVGWCTIEEPLVSPTTGFLFTRGPGMYKIPGFRDIPVSFKVTVMDGVRNERAIKGSKAVGEPPFFLGASCYFAIREAIKAARLEFGAEGYFRMDSPATSERIRLSCIDPFVKRANTPFKPGEKPWAVPL